MGILAAVMAAMGLWGVPRIEGRQAPQIPMAEHGAARMDYQLRQLQRLLGEA